MKKISFLLICFVFCFLYSIRAQVIFDQLGNQYTPEQLMIHDAASASSGTGGTNSMMMSYCTSGIFNAYYTIGGQFDPSVSSAANARLSVICRVLGDVSNFISSPLKTNGLGNKVNILIEDISSIPNVNPNALAMGISFYYFPRHPNSGLTVSLGGLHNIVDNTIWQTINSGHDAYEGMLFPTLYQTTAYVPGTRPLLHGGLAFKLSTNFNTNLNNLPGASEYDLYTIALHELTHALGIQSLITSQGWSVFNGTATTQVVWDYSRYDTKLYTQSGQQLIQADPNCKTYGAVFNPNLLTPVTATPTTADLAILSPQYGSGAKPALIPDNTNCFTAINYVGSITMPVFTPNVFSDGSSLAHFEDQCQAPFSNANNKYYVMAEQAIPGPAGCKRSYTVEERLVLCDLGYGVNTTFGVNSGGNPNYIDYALLGQSFCPGLNVGGTNDGVKNGFFQYVTSPGIPIIIPKSPILQNDHNAAAMNCLEVVVGAGSITHVTSTSFTYIPSSSSQDEIHVLRYIPTSPSGAKGNTTYIFISVKNMTCSGCANPSTTNYINNGSFESSTWCGPVLHAFNPNDAKVDCWTSFYGDVDLNGNNAIGGCAGAGANTGIRYLTFDFASYQSFASMISFLNTPIESGRNYTLTINYRTATNSKMEVYLSKELPTPILRNNPVPPPFSLLKQLGSTISMSNTNGLWSNRSITVNLTIPTGGKPEDYPYLILMATEGIFDLDDVSISPTSTVPALNTASSLLLHYGVTNGILTTSNKIDINGTFSVDVPINFNNCPNIICRNNSDITVQNGQTLSITNGSVVRGNCDFWKGIITGYSSSNPAHVIIEDSRIQDMQDGVLIKGYTTLSCKNSKFIDNVVGIDFFLTPVGYTDVVEDNDFFYNVRGGYVGIKIRECSNVKIGNLSTGKGNSFFDLETGIHIEHLKAYQSYNPYYSNYYALPHIFEIYNSDFHDIKGGRLIAESPYVNGSGTDRKGSAIYAYNDGAIGMGHSLTKVGTIVVNYTSHTGNSGKFRNVDKGLYIKGHFSADVRYMDMLYGWGIYSEDATYQNFTIRNNKITDAVVAVSLHGSVENSTISDNTISTISLLPPIISGPGGFVDGKGIEVTNYPYLYSTNASLDIHKNNIETFTGAGSGITLSSAGCFASIWKNTIILNTLHAFPVRFSSLAGISSVYNNSISINENTIDNIPASKSSSKNITGIQLTSSVNNLIACNILSNMSNGIAAEGNCSTYLTYVNSNKFNDHYYAMLFRHMGIEGTVGHIGSAVTLGTAGVDCNNLFNYTNGSGGSKHLYRFAACTTPMPIPDRIHTHNALTSGTTNTSSMCLNTAYVRVSSSSPTPTTCGITNGGGGAPTSARPVYEINNIDYERLIAQDLMVFGEYQAGSSWLERTRLFHELKVNPGIAASDSVLNSFYLANLTSPIGEVENVNHLIFQADTTKDSSLFVNYWQSAQAANNSLQLFNLQVTNEQTINGIYLKYMFGGRDTLSESDSSIIANLAFKCPLVDGNSVYKARSLFLLYQPLINFNNFGLCNYPDPENPRGIFDSEEEFLENNDTTGGEHYKLLPNKIASSNSSILRLYPNPVTSTLNIEFSKTGVLEFSDVMGRKIKSIDLSKEKNGKASVLLNDVKNGLCVCRYYVDGKLVEVSKITILHE